MFFDNETQRRLWLEHYASDIPYFSLHHLTKYNYNLDTSLLSFCNILPSLAIRNPMTAFKTTHNKHTGVSRIMFQRGRILGHHKKGGGAHSRTCFLMYSNVPGSYAPLYSSLSSKCHKEKAVLTLSDTDAGF